MILAIDPGTSAGATYKVSDKLLTMRWLNKPLTKTKKREGEPKYFRLKKFWDHLTDVHVAYGVTCIVYEGAQGFLRGKAAVEASHKFRAVIELFCAQHGIECVEIQPNDLKYYALGKRTGDKPEMIKAANRKGYEGNQDDEADSYLMWFWYMENYRHEAAK